MGHKQKKKKKAKKKKKTIYLPKFGLFPETNNWVGGGGLKYLIHTQSSRLQASFILCKQAGMYAHMHALCVRLHTYILLCRPQQQHLL